MTVERVTSGFLGAPEFKVTRVDHSTSELVGAYAGWLADQTFFVGGGGYWMVNDHHHGSDSEMGYGGLVLGLFVHRDRAVGFGIKGLLGGGSATLVRSATVVDYGRGDIRGFGPQLTPQLQTVNVRTHEHFFIAEPEANIVFKLSDVVRVTAGAGYRFTGAERGWSSSDLNGATANVAVQIGGGR